MGNQKCPKCKGLNYVVTQQHVSLYIVYCKHCKNHFTISREKKTENARQK